MPKNAFAHHVHALTQVLLACSFALAGSLATTSSATAQGVLIDIRPEYHIRLPRPIIQPVPQPASTYKIDALEVNATLTRPDRPGPGLANVREHRQPTDGSRVRVSAALRRRDRPADAAGRRQGISSQAALEREARRRYEEIVRKNRDPALLEWVGTGMFQTSVFPIPPGAKRTVTLRYSQLCRKSHGLTDFLFPLSTAKYTAGPVEKLSFQLTIESTSPIKNVYSATHAVKIERPDNTHAVVTYDATKIVPGDDFRLFFDAGDGSVGASVVSYRPKPRRRRLLPAAGQPRDQSRRGTAPVAKTVVFVVDRSGSMSGKKIEQAKGALKFVLNNLHEGDMFNIVAYDSAIETFRPELQKFDDETRTAAIGFVDGLYAGGSTNIDGALHRALDLLTDSSRPDLRHLPHRRPAHRRRNRRIHHRKQRQSRQPRPRPPVHLRRRLRRQQPAARQARPRQLRPKRIRPAQRKHRSRRQQALQPHRLTRDDRRLGHRRRRRRQTRCRRRPSTASIPRARSICSPATRSCSSAATSQSAKPR